MAINIKGNKALLRKLESLRQPIDRKTAKDLGEWVVKGIRDLTASGTSTVREFGRKMPAYRGSYRRRIIRGGFPGKRLRPVNLRLTGKFMRSLKSRVKKSKGGFSPIVGYFNAKESAKEEGHRQGTNKQAKRPTLPTSSESFHRAIEKMITKHLRDRLRAVINKRS